jgi:hypothetical protein
VDRVALVRDDKRRSDDGPEQRAVGQGRIVDALLDRVRDGFRMHRHERRPPEVSLAGPFVEGAFPRLRLQDLLHGLIERHALQNARQPEHPAVGLGRAVQPGGLDEDELLEPAWVARDEAKDGARSEGDPARARRAVIAGHGVEVAREVFGRVGPGFRQIALAVPAEVEQDLGPGEELGDEPEVRAIAGEAVSEHGDGLSLTGQLDGQLHPVRRHGVHGRERSGG